MILGWTVPLKYFYIYKIRADSVTAEDTILQVTERKNDRQQNTEPTTWGRLLCALMRGHMEQNERLHLFTKTALLAPVIDYYVQFCMCIPHLRVFFPRCFHHQPLIPGHLKIERKHTYIHWAQCLQGTECQRNVGWCDNKEKVKRKWFKACFSVILWHIEITMCHLNVWDCVLNGLVMGNITWRWVMGVMLV